MRSDLLKVASVAAMVVIAACAQRSMDTRMNSKDAVVESNTLLAEWTGPYGGVPAFDKMDLDALKPALETGMARQLAEIDAIASNPEPPTFENTIVAMERVGHDLGRVFTYYGIWSSNRSTPEFREIQREMSPNSKCTATRP